MAKISTSSRYPQVKIFKFIRIDDAGNISDATEESINKFLLEYPGARVLYTNDNAIVFSYMKEFDAKPKV